MPTTAFCKQKVLDTIGFEGVDRCQAVTRSREPDADGGDVAAEVENEQKPPHFRRCNNCALYGIRFFEDGGRVVMIPVCYWHSPGITERVMYMDPGAAADNDFTDAVHRRFALQYSRGDADGFAAFKNKMIYRPGTEEHRKFIDAERYHATLVRANKMARQVRWGDDVRQYWEDVIPSDEVKDALENVRKMRKKITKYTARGRRAPKRVYGQLQRATGDLKEIEAQTITDSDVQNKPFVYNLFSPFNDGRRGQDNDEKEQHAEEEEEKEEEEEEPELPDFDPGAGFADLQIEQVPPAPVAPPRPIEEIRVPKRTRTGREYARLGRSRRQTR
jgi:hypothetical protein